MSSEIRCEYVRDLAPELALGIADGEERAQALEHLVGCQDCRRYLDELSSTADDLLFLAPAIEPPTGFESRVADAIASPRRATRRWRRPMVLAGTALASGAIVAGAMIAIFHDDHKLATDYRQTLSEADGNYFAANDLKAPGGREVGNVFRYEGMPSFVLVSVRDSSRKLPDGVYDCQFVDGEGRSTSFGKLHVQDGEGSYGRSVDTSLDDVRQVRLVGPGSGDVIEATLGSE